MSRDPQDDDIIIKLGAFWKLDTLIRFSSYLKEFEIKFILK